MENIVCIGCVPLRHSGKICLFFFIFFVLFCISPPSVLYIGVLIFCVNMPMNDVGYKNTIGYGTTYLSNMVRLQKRMNELNPSQNEIKTILIKALVLSKITFRQSFHSKNCRLIIQHHMAPKADTDIDELIEFYKNPNVNLWNIRKHISWGHFCAYSGLILWICLYVIVVSVFLLCFGYSEDRMDSFLRDFYIILYAIVLLLSLCIMLLHYLDPLMRMKKHFGWMEAIRWGEIYNSKWNYIMSSRSFY